MLRFLSEHATRGFKAKELQRALRIPHSRYRELRRQLRELAETRRIALLPRRRYAALTAATRLEGVVEGVSSFPTRVRLSDDSVLPLSSRAVDSVVCGDRIRIRKIHEDGEMRAAIDRLLLAARREVFGTLHRVGSNWVLEPEPEIPSLRGGVFLEGDVDDECEGCVASGTLPAFEPAVERPKLKSVDVLGTADHPQAAMLGHIIASGWPRRFSAEAEQFASEWPRPEIPRRDFTGERVFTIDPLDAKDHDDAVSIEVRPDGGVVLGVFIADVAARVPVGTPLDEEARLRCTSVYPPGRVLPMLPEVLSAGACSLHHGGRRDVIAVRLHYSAGGRREHVELGLAEIRSQASLSYEHAQALLDDRSRASVEAERLAEGTQVSDLADDLEAMFGLARKLRDRRRAKGSLFVQRPEREFVFGADGHVADTHYREPLSSHWIIEEFMLEANRAVAQVLHEAEAALLWRVHDSPDEKKVDALSEVLETFGIQWAPRTPVTGQDYGELFARVAKEENAPLIHLLALRSLMKAHYSEAWHGHFGLAFDHYTHFTSPIRRYPDLHNQRLLHQLVSSVGSEGWLDDAFAGAAVLAQAKLTRPAERRDTARLADLCSELERRAQVLERRCADICAADALRSRQGEVVDGSIVSVVPSGFFVEVEGSGLDGYVGAESLGREWFAFDRRRQAQVGETSGRSFRLGQRVRVLLEYVDVRQGKLWLGKIEPLRRQRSPQGRNRE